MEFLLELLFEIFGEVILQVVFEALAEVGLHLFRAPTSHSEGQATWRLVLGYTFLGLVAGGLSLVVFPHSFLHSRPLRFANLVITPVASGLAMALLGSLRKRSGHRVLGIDRFSYGFIFAFAMAAVRFQWAQ